ncbi:MAG: CPBP family intramembrane metalloprotease [Sedimentisphaerales bacterium]|nr:CPBP family intramembrane metalloprotease [Sedimentisphaerales bacterium]
MFFVNNLLLTGLLGYGYNIYISAAMFILVAAGLALFAYWATTREFGSKELDRAVFRYNSMPYYIPAAVVCGWLGMYMVAADMSRELTEHLPKWEQEFITYLIIALIDVVLIVFILGAVRKYFAAGLAGFGLRKKGILKDIGAAALVFLTVWPLATGSLRLVAMFGTIIKGAEFHMQQNEGLVVILEGDQIGLRIFMIFFAAVITPVFEELVFRGLVQTYFRNIGYSPWRSIFMASVIFSLLHPLMHLPALLILSIAMGYAYEKSGSLLRAIFVHCIFNSVMITFALLGSKAI